MDIETKPNPKAALDALFPLPIGCGNGVYVYPLSLAHYAILEKIGSYIIFAHEPSALEVMETLFICTHPSKQSVCTKEELDAKATEWAEKLPPFMIGKITDAILQQINLMSAVAPKFGDDDGKKAEPQTVG